jgi:hypothetical protein
VLPPAAAAVVALCVTQIVWLLDSRQEWRAASVLERLGGSLIWAWRLDPRLEERRYPCFEPQCWLLPGDGFVVGVHLLNCREPNLDQKLAGLGALGGLRSLALGNTAITDEVLRHVAGLSRLEWLDLHDTPITDNGIRHLATARQLQWLNLSNTRITDASLSHLASLNRLKRINLVGTDVTAAGLALLRAQLPATEIQSDLEAST